MLLAALCCVAARKPADPAEAAVKDKPLFLRHLERAKVDFNLQEYDKAAKEWRAAYRKKPVPVLLFNIGQAHRLGGHYKDARLDYANYLRDEPQATNRAEVEGLIEGMPKRDRPKKSVATHRSRKASAP